MIDEILKYHEREKYGIKHVFYKNKEKDFLFISFSGKVDFYCNVSWFYRNNDVDGCFLFLKNDPDYDTYTNESYLDLIKFYCEQYQVKNIMTYGLSMGGIASIHYGLSLNAFAILSFDPHPIKYDLLKLYELIDNYDFDYEKIFINYTLSGVESDTKIPIHTLNILNKLSKKNVFLTVQPYLSPNHLDFIPSKEYLLNIINMFNDVKVINHDKKIKNFI